MMKRMMFNVLTPVVTALSVMCMPIAASAQGPCNPPQPCCEEDPCCGTWSNAWLRLGAAALGAGAGAATAAAISNGKKGRHGRDGRTGPTGPAGSLAGPTGPAGATGPIGPSAFTVVTGGVLTFGFDFTSVSIELPFAGPIPLAFVATPDGRVVTQPFSTVGIPPIIGTGSDALIAIDDPVIGQYGAGIQFSAGTVISASILSVTVEDPTVTTLLPDITGISVTLGSDDIQFFTEFTFDPFDLQ